MSKDKYKVESETLKRKIESGVESLGGINKIYNDLGKTINETEEKAIYNTDVYLTLGLYGCLYCNFDEK